MTVMEAFVGVIDPRTGPAQRHDLHEMIVMALCAVLCGADTWVDIADWAEDNADWLKRYLILAHGTPSYDTFGRVFRILDARVFEASFRQWIAGLVGVINGKVSCKRAFYIGSQGITDGKTFAQAVRSHWAIENSLHWVLDVTFREDECRVRKGHAPQNFSALRKLALMLLRRDQTYTKRSLRSRRKTADRIPDFRASLLGLQTRG